jgi:U3 small nucleolar RNA-associated protein 10
MMTEVCKIALLDLASRRMFSIGFWRDDRLRQIATPLIQQVPRCTMFPADSEAKELLQQSLDALVEDVSDDSLLKNINLDLLMHTRSDNPQVRRFALVCSESLWRAHGGKLIGMFVNIIN